MLVALVLWNFGNYVFFLEAGRLLGPKDYGLVAALLAGTLVVSLPAQGLQLASARSEASLAPSTRRADGVYRVALRRCAHWSAIVGVAATFVVVAVGIVGHAPTGPLVVTVFASTPLALFFLGLGRIQGRRRYRSFAACFLTWGLVRPVLLPAFAAAGFHVYGALLATLVGIAAATALALWLARPDEPPTEATEGDWRAFVHPIRSTVVGLLAFGLLTNTDVIAAKLTLAPEVAGRFAAASAIVKAVFLIPQTAASVILPRVAHRTSAGAATSTLLAAGVVLSLAGGLAGSALVWAVAPAFVRLTFGTDYTLSGTFLAGYAAAVTPIGAVYVLLSYYAAKSRLQFARAAAAVALLQMLLFTAFHRSAGAIVVADGATGLIALVVHEWMGWSTDERVDRAVRGLLHYGRGTRSPHAE